jgi:hypothetical protein
MALVDDGRSLIVADSYAQQLIEFAVGPDGTLSPGRVWADLEHAPDGICADEDGAVWSRVSLPSGACGCERGARYSTPCSLIEAASRACSAEKTAAPCSSAPPGGAEWRPR